MFQVFSLPNTALYHLYTLFLFTKSDIKTTVIPIVRLVDATHSSRELTDQFTDCIGGGLSTVVGHSPLTARNILDMVPRSAVRRLQSDS